MKAFPFVFVLLFISRIGIAQFVSAGTSYNCDKCQIGDIKFGDMDNDGHLDMVLVNFNLILSTDRNRLVWFKNDGFGRFLPRQTISTENGQGSGLLLTDIDKDGDLDIIVSYQSSTRVVYHENSGNGVFGPEKLIINNILAPKLIESLGDYDGNGFDDFMCAAQNINDKGIRLFMVDKGNISVNIIYPNSTTANGRFKSIDFDKDGDIDIIGQPTNSSTVNWFKNENGTFNSGLSLLSFPPNTFSFAFDIGDINNDGDLDIVSSNTNDQNLAYYENAGPGQIPVFPVKKNIQKIGNQKQVKLVDIDQDNDLDILTMNNTTQSLLIFENYGGNGFSSGRQIMYPGFGGSNPSAATMHMVDFDKDGDTDIFVVNSGNGNTGGGNVQYLENTTISSYISGSYYYDENENGKKDEGEAIIKDILPGIVPGAFEINFNDENGFKLRVRKGKYTVSFQNNPCWYLTPGQPNTYVINLDTTNHAVIHFGVKRKSDSIDAMARLTSGQTRCGFTVPFNIQIKNTGCEDISGTVKIVLHPLATPLPDPNSEITIEGDTMYLTYNTLFSEKLKTEKINFNIAGVEFLGDTISMPVYAYVRDSTGIERLVDSSEFFSVINCAYDPNDKLVEPNRDSRNFTLQNETLFYTIRFQNTGTDTAFTVLIRDTLDARINVNTLSVYNSSHACTSTFNVLNNSLIFRFDNILLPDSATDLQGSQGFVSFYCKTKDVSPKTQITNKSFIYFDFNPPIETNMVSSTIVKEFNCLDSISPAGKYTLPASLQLDIEPITCHDQNDGKLLLYIRNGTPPFILNASDTFQNEFLMEQLTDSIYALNIRDSGNCVLSELVELNRPDSITVSSKLQHATGNQSNGSISIESISGGTPPYTLEWNNGSGEYKQDDLSPGIHELKITDFKGCQKTTVFRVESLTGTIAQPEELHASVIIYGNPSQNNLVFCIKPDYFVPNRIEIINQLGECIFSSGSEAHVKNIYSIDIENQPEGVYILNVYLGKKIRSEKFAIVR